MLTKEQVRDVLLAGEPVVDIGQIDAPTKAILKRWVASGVVVRGWSHEFPIRKRAWSLAGTVHYLHNFVSDAALASFEQVRRAV